MSTRNKISRKSKFMKEKSKKEKTYLKKRVIIVSKKNKISVNFPYLVWIWLKDSVINKPKIH